MVGLTGAGASIGGVALIVALVGLGYMLWGHGDEQKLGRKFFAVSGVVSIVFLILMFVGIAGLYQNQFYNRLEEYKNARADVGVLEGKVVRLGDELLSFRDAYVSLDKELTKAVSERNTESLKFLLERYPQLQASAQAQRSMDEFVALVDDVAYQKRVANAVARAYNRSHKTTPSKWFSPGDIPERLELYDLPENK